MAFDNGEQDNSQQMTFKKVRDHDYKGKYDYIK